MPAKIVLMPGGLHRRPAAPDEEVELWRRRLGELLGTDSGHFIDASLRRLMIATILPDEAAPSEESLSAALAFVGALRPENEVEPHSPLTPPACTQSRRPYWPGSALSAMSAVSSRSQRLLPGWSELFILRSTPTTASARQHPGHQGREDRDPGGGVGRSRASRPLAECLEKVLPEPRPTIARLVADD